jgi:hypothetical protein
MEEPGKFVTRGELLAALAVDEEFLIALEREEIVRVETQGLYSSATVERIRICQTLHHDLGVNLAGLEVALNLLDRIRSERRQFQGVLAWLRETFESKR